MRSLQTGAEEASGACGVLDDGKLVRPKVICCVQANASFPAREGWKRDSASTESAELATGEKRPLAPIQNRS